MKLTALANLYLKPIDQLLAESEGFQYVAVHASPDTGAIGQVAMHQLNGALSEIQSAYALSILERCHLASLTSVAKLNSWLTATLDMAKAGNALGFSASLRGFL